MWSAGRGPQFWKLPFTDPYQKSPKCGCPYDHMKSAPLPAVLPPDAVQSAVSLKHRGFRFQAEALRSALINQKKFN